MVTLYGLPKRFNMEMPEECPACGGPVHEWDDELDTYDKFVECSAFHLFCDNEKCEWYRKDVWEVEYETVVGSVINVIEYEQQQEQKRQLERNIDKQRAFRTLNRITYRPFQKDGIEKQFLDDLDLWTSFPEDLREEVIREFHDWRNTDE